MANYYDKSTLIQLLKEKASELGRKPKPEDMTDPSAHVFLSYFKKWDKALKAAGLYKDPVSQVQTPPPVATPTKTVSFKKADTIVEEAPKKAEKPCQADVKAEKKPEAKATTACPTKRRYSKSIITKMLLDEFNRLGKKPTRKEIDANKNLPTVSTCLSYFDTTRIGDVWAEVLKDQ